MEQAFLPLCVGIDGFQMSIKRPTSGGGGGGGQTCDQKAAIQQAFHLERSSLSLGINGKDSM